MSSYRILEGDCIDVLAGLPAESVQTCVTSPPYWGLRDYGTAAWDGGDPECDHAKADAVQGGSSTLGIPANGGPKRISDNNSTTIHKEVYRDTCGKCGATRIDSQLGLEPTPEQYVENMVAVFREVRRVLRDDGTLWLNLGDSYASSGNGGDTRSGFNARYFGNDYADGKQASHGENRASVKRGPIPDGLKPKDLVGIPWMVAFALRADGWYLRSDIIWAKPNPMPESVTDRPTKAHEYLFLLTKNPRYFYDADAIREGDGVSFASNGFKAEAQAQRQSVGTAQSGGTGERAALPIHGRNKRSVWTVATQPFPGAHFATFPPKLIEPCILAGSPPKCCGECGAPWERVVELIGDTTGRRLGDKNITENAKARGMTNESRAWKGGDVPVAERRQLGWRSTCDHGVHGETNVLSGDNAFSRSVVLDPFNGAGTTGVVALRHDRDYIGIELSPEYAEMTRQRLYDDAPLLNYEATA